MTTAHHRYDVAIVGLGPVGMTLAHLLCAEGLSVVGLDIRGEPCGFPRAIGLDHESLRVFQRIGIAAALLPFTEIYRPSEYRAADGSLLRRIVAAPEPHPLAWPPNLTFVQPELERIFLESARRLANLTLHLRTEVEAATTDTAGVDLLVRPASATGVLPPVRSRYLVACDGATSRIRQNLNVPLEDLSFDEPWLVIDVLLKGDVVLPEVNIQVCDPKRPMTYFRGPGQLRRWEIMMLPGESPSEVLAEDRVWNFLTPWISPAQGTIWRAATYHFHALIAEQWRHGQIFLAGDACHQMPPFLAQGLNQGLRDVANLAWKLAAVARGDAPDALLDTYERERKANVRAVTNTTKDLGRIICERDERLAGERNTRMLEEFAAGKGHFVRQNFLPPLADGLLDPDRRSEGPGECCPQPWIATSNGWRRMDDVIGSGFRILVVGNFEVTAEVEEFAAAIRATISSICPPGIDQHGWHRGRGRLIERDGVLSDWMARRSCSAAVVRPDNIVFGVASGSDALAGVLARLCGALKKTSPAATRPSSNL